MVVIRLSRAGAKKRPFYHMVVIDSRKRRDGSCIERVGYFDPMRKENSHIQMERVQYWQSVGAQLSDRVASLIKEYNKTAQRTA